MLYCCHSVFCSGHILAVPKKDIIYDVSQMPEFMQLMVGLHVVDGQYALIWGCSSLFCGKERNYLEIDGMCGNS